LIVADGTDPLLRRISLRALGRVGGDMAFPVLQRALLSKSADDKDAAMRGLGELRDPRAAHVLADLAVLGHGKDLGALARLHLQRQPGMLAIPAVRAQMQIVQDKAIRADLVLLVGGWHDAAGVPDLMDLLREPKHAPIASVLLEGATGLSFAAAQDRIDMAEQWYRANKQKPQWQWLLDALRADKVPTSLLPEQFAAEAGLVAVPELARLLVEAPEGRFWALSAAVLRSVTGEDFGAINAQSPTEAREAVAARYRIAFETGTVSGR
ncbi:MAG: HEAT repeat domain-containing protein, partial [Planctomycetes bacterium]|nr:HEAT repeat domain-containing protein [Planctomycetota bacterium]